MNEIKKRILITRTDRLGDVVLSTAIPREIKKTYPDSFVAVLVRNYTVPVYENNPYVDAILTDDFTEETRSKTFWQKIKEIKQYNFTDALMLLPSERLTYMLFWAGIKNRIGVSRKLYQFLTFTKYVMRNFEPLRSEADYCMDLARKIGVESDNISSEIFLTNEEIKESAQLKEKWSAGNKKIIGIHSSSGNSAPNMPAEEYRNLAEKLIETGRYKVIITDPAVPDELQGIEDAEYINLPLRKLFVNIKAFDLLVSASTGPMHAAAALKVNTLSVFCTLNSCHPNLWGPKGNQAFIVLPDKEFCRVNCSDNPHYCSLNKESGINAEVLFRKINELKL